MTVALIIDNAQGANFANERAHNLRSLLIGASGLPVGDTLLEVYGEVFLQGPITFGSVPGTENIGPIVLSPQPETLGAGDNNDLAVNNRTGILRLTTDAGGSALTGITGGKDGRVIRIAKFGAGDLTISDESASSAATNRFSLPGGSDIILAVADTPGVLTVQYDGATDRWVT